MIPHNGWDGRFFGSLYFGSCPMLQAEHCRSRAAMALGEEYTALDVAYDPSSEHSDAFTLLRTVYFSQCY